MRILDAHHGSQPPKTAMTWKQQRVQNTTSAPWRKGDVREQPAVRRPRPAKERQPTWEQINDLKKRIDTLSTTASPLSFASPSSLPTKEAEADKARLTSLRRMRAEATNQEDQTYLDAKILELSARLSRGLPLHDRLKLAREKCDAAKVRLERNEAHLQRAKASLEAAKVNHTACIQELEAVQAEVSSDLQRDLPQQQHSQQLMQQAAKALRHLAAMAMNNNGVVQFSAELLADVGSVIDALPKTSMPPENGFETCDDEEIELASDYEHARANTPIGLTPDAGRTTGQRSQMSWTPQAGDIPPFSRAGRPGRVRLDPYSTPAQTRHPARERTRSA